MDRDEKREALLQATRQLRTLTKHGCAVVARSLIEEVLEALESESPCACEGQEVVAGRYIFIHKARDQQAILEALDSVGAPAPLPELGITKGYRVIILEGKP